MNLKNLLKITKKQFFTGLTLSTGLFFINPNLDALEKSTPPEVTKPVGRYVPPHMRGTQAPFRPAALSDPDLVAIDLAGLAVTPRASFSTPSPLNPRSEITSARDRFDDTAAPAPVTIRKKVSFAEPEVTRTSRTFSPKPLSTYADFLANLAKLRVDYAAREARIANARRIHDACDIADLGRSVRLAYAPKSVRFEAEYQAYLRENSLSAAYQSPEFKEKLKVVITAKEI